jgi:hypothetical protein
MTVWIVVGGVFVFVFCAVCVVALIVATALPEWDE